MAQLDHGTDGAHLPPQSIFLALVAQEQAEVYWTTKASCAQVWTHFPDLTSRQVLKSLSALVILSCVKPVHQIAVADLVPFGAVPDTDCSI